jgi:hypothetical protein
MDNYHKKTVSIAKQFFYFVSDYYNDIVLSIPKNCL